jgi:hypothetical protein
MATRRIPEGYHTVTPYLAVEDATEAIEYYTKAFDAKERVRMETPDGKVGHAELEIGDSLVMLSDPFPQASTKPPNERRRGREAGGRRGRNGDHGGRRPVLGRPLRLRQGSVRPLVVDRHACRGRPAGGNGGARQGGDGRNEQLALRRGRRASPAAPSSARGCGGTEAQMSPDKKASRPSPNG